MPKCKMKISDLRVWVHLGCTEAERQNPHLVSIDIKFIFSDEPKAVDTDDINDALCYLQTAKRIQSLLENKHFNLIEHLAKYIHQGLNDFAKAKFSLDEIRLKVTKVNPPVPGIHGGVSFYYNKGIH